MRDVLDLVLQATFERDARLHRLRLSERSSSQFWLSTASSLTAEAWEQHLSIQGRLEPWTSQSMQAGCMHAHAASPGLEPEHEYIDP